MFRRLVTTAAVLMVVAVMSVLAAERGTFILTDGERKSGPIVFHGDQHENMIAGYYNLGGDGGKDMSFPVDQVAVIDFVGGQPPTTELAKLGNSQMLVLRNGVSQEGRLINLIGGDTLIWENLGKQQQRYGISDVARVYLIPQSARTAFNYTPPPAPAATAAAQAPGQPAAQNGRTRNQGNAPNTGRADTGTRGNRDDQGTFDDQRNQRGRNGNDRGISVRMDARQGWTDAGVTVNRGDRLVFATDVATRGLVGRIGDGAPFAITVGQAVVMRGSGRLMLDVSDQERRNSRGTFTVTVSQP